MTDPKFWSGGRRRPRKQNPAGNVAAIWLAQCQLDRRGNPVANLFNTCLALRGDPLFVGRFRYDEMLRAVVHPDIPIEDSDLFLIREWLQQSGIERASIEDLRQAVDIVGREHPFHPLRDQLDAVARNWDGTGRNNHWLATYAGADDDDYAQVIGPKFLISMVARVYQPGCKADYMLVLEGEQGEEKSKLCRALAGDAYFSETLPELSSDQIRVSMHLRGKWLIEIADLHAFFSSRVDTARLKSFLTTREEQYTPKFGRNEVREKRQCVFIGTSNKRNYLRDETGGRRFWPVACRRPIDLPAFERDRDQLLAEAVHRYREGEEWWPDRNFELHVIKPQQDQRYEGDSWETLIEQWDRLDAERDSNGKPVYLDTGTGARVPAPRVGISGPPYYLIQIARGALQLERLSKPEEQRLVAVLESLGWRRTAKTRLGRPWAPA